MGDRVLVYGISGNPPSGMGGHLGIVSHFSKIQDQGQVWILPVFQHSFRSKNSSLVDFETRLQMCRAAFEKVGNNVHVKDFERRMCQEILHKTNKNGQPLDSVRIGTRDMHQYLAREFPDTHFSFILGSDTFNDLRAGKWKNSDDLLKTLAFEIVSRPGVTQGSWHARDGERINFHSVDGLEDVSSTLLRNCIAKSFAGENQSWDDFHSRIKQELISSQRGGMNIFSTENASSDGSVDDLNVFVHTDVLRIIFQNRLYSNI